MKHFLNADNGSFLQILTHILLSPGAAKNAATTGEVAPATSTAKGVVVVQRQELLSTRYLASIQTWLPLLLFA